METWYHNLECFDRDVNGLSWHRLREVLEETCQALPPETQDDVLKRCRNQTVPALADGYLFELVLYRLLVTLGFNVEWEPCLSTGKTPDFLAHGQGKSFYVEALAAGGDERLFGYSPKEQWVVEYLEEHLTFQSFGLWYLTCGTLDQNRGRKFFRKHLRGLQSFLNRCEADHSAIKEQWDKRGDPFEGPHSHRFKEGDWEMRLTLCPNRKGLHPYPEAKFLTPMRDQVEKRIKKKVRKYSHLEHPLLLAISLKSGHFDSSAMQADLAWGQPFVSQMPDGSTVWGREKDGIAATNASSLLCTGIDLWNMGHSQASFYQNPYSEDWREVPAGLLKLPHCTVAPSGLGQFRPERREGEPLPALIGLCQP